MLDGQKVWSSYAHIADFCILLARSDLLERHAGLTYVIVDMHAPGVEVRPLRQITGEAEFNEIFLTGVAAPLDNVIGDVGGGWDVAMTTLLHERGTLGFALRRAARGAGAEARRAGRRPRRHSAAARRDRAGVDPPAGTPRDGEPAAVGARAHGDPRPRGVDPQAAVVGGEPARDQARARAARPGRPAARAERAVRRVLADPRRSAAAATRSRPGRRRSCGTSSPSASSACRGRAADGPPSPPSGGAARTGARSFLEATPEPTWAQLAELGWTGAGVAEERGGAGLLFLEEAVLHEEAGRALLHGPFWSTSSLLPFLPADDQAAVAA